MFVDGGDDRYEATLEHLRRASISTAQQTETKFTTVLAACRRCGTHRQFDSGLDPEAQNMVLVTQSAAALLHDEYLTALISTRLSSSIKTSSTPSITLRGEVLELSLSEDDIWRSRL